jgi:hypothetical protein
MNAAQQFVALLMHGKLQGGRDYRAEHAHRATPPRPPANIRSTTVGDETFRMTRGERKRLRRVAAIAKVLEGGALPLRHQHPRRNRRAA